MVSNKIKELAQARAQIALLEKAIADERAELAALPAKYGFASAADFVKAVKAAAAASGGRRGRKSATGKVAKAVPAAAKTKASAGRKRRKRAVITDETRASLKKMVEAGKTGGEIAKSLGISLPSVQNIKKALGLVKKR